MTDEMIEQLAKMLFEANPSRNPALQWNHAGCPRARYIKHVRAYTNSLAKAGLGIRPREPTEEMAMAGANRTDRYAWVPMFDAYKPDG